MQLKELNGMVFGFGQDDADVGLVVSKGKNNGRYGGNRSKSCSKLRSRGN